MTGEKVVDFRGRGRSRVVDTDTDNPTGDARPIVNIESGRRAEAISAAEAHLIERDSGVFQRSDFVVRVAPEEIDAGGGRKVNGLRILQIGPQYMRERFNREVDLRKYDRRADAFVSTDCPKDFAEAFLERIGEWRLPRLRSVVTAPALRYDGSIVDRPGLDPDTGIYYNPCGVHFPAISGAPDRADALAAINQLSELIGSFPFVDETARSAALSALMTPVLRTAMRTAPAHGISSNAAGTGKTLLVDVSAILATGHYAPVTSLGANEEETEKRLATVLMAGDPIIALDNCKKPVGGDFLCQIITQPSLSVRLLGSSLRRICTNTASLFATGNNLRFSGDMATRRALVCQLDAGCERPELREFETPDPSLVALVSRSKFVTAILTIARAFNAEGRPRQVRPIGSFGDWCTWVRDPLIWLGYVDPAGAMVAARQDNPELSRLVAVLEAWGFQIGDRRITGREVVELVDKKNTDGGWLYSELRDALMAVAGDRGEVSSRRLGMWLGSVKGQVANGKRLISAPPLRGAGRWQLVGSEA